VTTAHNNNFKPVPLSQNEERNLYVYTLTRLSSDNMTGVPQRKWHLIFHTAVGLI
jgi:hypothetical protein